MKGPWFQIAALCSILFGIVIFSVVVGGYSSINRSQGRIKDSASYLTDACMKRIQLLPKLIKLIQTPDTQKTIQSIEMASEKALVILKQTSPEKALLEELWVREFENSQEDITHLLKKTFTQDEAIVKNNKPYNALKQEIYSAQDYIFIVRQRYNKEADYFNIRTNAFPGFLFAKWFGFDKITYYPISLDKLLPAHQTFP